MAHTPALFILSLYFWAPYGPIDGLHLGESITGPKLDEKKIDGRVVLIEFWSLQSGASRASMTNLTKWHDELADFGLIVIAMHDDSAKANEIKTKSRSMNLPFAVTKGGSLDDRKAGALPHCVLFDHNGKAIARGSPAEMERRVYAAVVSSLFEKPGLSNMPPQISSIVENIRKGQSPATALQKLQPLTQSKDAAVAAKAKSLIAAMTAGAEARFAVIEDLAAENPVVGYSAAQRFATTFKGTPTGKKAESLISQLRLGGDVQVELKTRPMLEKVKRIDEQLAPKAEKTNPESPEFQRNNAVQVKQMRAILKMMQDAWPDAPATQEAAEICRKYGG